ncbi:MarR family transcriptional regulator [Dactylosporangium roseum]|uniref:MarR family transcriptional regulator n=1 Tax=Dactylosporangium roseum TaxID=47989 RepID=A0ABY5ZDI7_9ACTN|nr:MarR family transcriptional regulator [Dactylosporangium roseum]UWZ38748.1 MarR family transcriptional regulator [Dactylosporangium roseum]
MTQAPETPAHTADDLQSDLGWALGVVLRGYAKGAQQVIADVPGGPRGYQVLTSAVAGTAGTQLALANKLGIDRTVMTYLLDDLEKAGLIERQPDPADRRARRILSTEAGRAALCALRAKLRRVEERVLGGLAEPDRTMFRDLLRRVAIRIDEQDPLVDACGPIAEFADVEPAARARRRRS